MGQCGLRRAGMGRSGQRRLARIGSALAACAAVFAAGLWFSSTAAGMRLERLLSSSPAPASGLPAGGEPVMLAVLGVLMVAVAAAFAPRFRPWLYLLFFAEYFLLARFGHLLDALLVPSGWLASPASAGPAGAPLPAAGIFLGAQATRLRIVPAGLSLLAFPLFWSVIEPWLRGGQSADRAGVNRTALVRAVVSRLAQIEPGLTLISRNPSRSGCGADLLCRDGRGAPVWILLWPGSFERIMPRAVGLLLRSQMRLPQAQPAGNISLDSRTGQRIIMVIPADEVPANDCLRYFSQAPVAIYAYDRAQMRSGGKVDFVAVPMPGLRQRRSQVAVRPAQRPASASGPAVSVSRQEVLALLEGTG